MVVICRDSNKLEGEVAAHGARSDERVLKLDSEDAYAHRNTLKTTDLNILDYTFVVCKLYLNRSTILEVIGIGSFAKYILVEGLLCTRH